MDNQYGYIADSIVKRIIDVCKEHNKYKAVFQHVYKDYEPVMQIWKDHGAYLHFGWPVENGSNFYTVLALKLQLQGNNQVRVLWASQLGMRLLSTEQARSDIHKRCRRLDSEHTQRVREDRKRAAERADEAAHKRARGVGN